MNQDLKQYAQLHDENIELKKKLNDYKKQITELNNKLFNERRKSTILNEDLKSSNFLFNLDIQDIDPEIKQIVDKEYYNMLNCGEIEKAAEKHADTIIDAGETYHGFIAGTKWAIERLKGEREWISVNDRLPENNIDVIVRLDIGTIDTDYLTSTNEFEFFNKRVTHWIPWPESPKQ